MNKVTFTKFTLLILMPTICGACGGGSNSSNPSVENNGFVIGGTVAGLVDDKQVVLQNNGEDELRVVQNGNFSFNKNVVPGANYSVTVKLQPDGLNCAVDFGSGQAVTDIDNIKVKCTPTPNTDIAQLTGKWDALDSCRMFRAGLGYAISFLEVNIQGNIPSITEGIRVYEKNDCKTKFMFLLQDSEPSTMTVRSAFVRNDIRIFRLSLASTEQGTRLLSFWIPNQQNNLCLMDDDMEKTDETIAEKIISNPSLSEHCYSRVE